MYICIVSEIPYSFNKQAKLRLFFLEINKLEFRGKKKEFSSIYLPEKIRLASLIQLRCLQYFLGFRNTKSK